MRGKHNTVLAPSTPHGGVTSAAFCVAGEGSAPRECRVRLSGGIGR